MLSAMTTRVRLSNPLQARCKVRRLAHDPAPSAPDPIRSPTTTRPVAMPTRVCSEPYLQSHYRCDQFQSCPYGPLCVVFMGLG